MLHTMRGRAFDEFMIDEEIAGGVRTVTESEVVHFSDISWDAVSLGKSAMFFLKAELLFIREVYVDAYR